MPNRRLIAFLFMLFLPGASLAEDACVDDSFRHFDTSIARPEYEKISEAALADAAKNTLKRRLSEKESKALFNAQRIGSLDGYTPSEIVQQDKLLKRAGMSQEEIARLRKNEILGNWVVEWKGAVPTSLKKIAVPFARFDKNTIKELKNGKSMYFVIDENDNLLVSRTKLSLDHSSLWTLPDANGGRLIKEAGEIKFDDVSKEMKLNPEYGMDLSDSEAAIASGKIKALNGDIAAKESLQGLQKSKVLNCLDIMKGRQTGKNFVLSRLASDNIVMTGAILASEGMGANRLGTQGGREVLTADMVGTNAAIAINATLGKYLILRDKGLGIAFLSRTATNLGLIQAQRELYENTLTDDAHARANKLAGFDTGYMLLRIPTHHFFDRYIMNKLPLYLFNACQKDNSLRVLVSPTMVRIYERTGSAILYYATRKSVIAE